MQSPQFTKVQKLFRSPLFIGFLIITAATFFLFGPVWRGEVPLPTQSIPGLMWGAPDQPAGPSIFRDRIVQAYPYHLFAAKAIQSGHLPLWNNLIFNGTTFFANGQAGILSLLKLPWWWLPPVASYVIVALLQSIVAGAGMLLLGRKLGWKPAASIVAGLTLTLSAPFVMRMTVTTMSAVIACLPFVLWSVLRLHERLSWPRTVTVAALVAIMIFSGHVQLAAFSLGFAIVWSFIWWRREQWLRRSILFILAFSLGLGLTAVQLIPIKESLGQAYRQPTERSWSTVLNPKRLFKPDIKYAASLATMADQNILGDKTHYRGPGNFIEGNLYIGPFALLFVLASCYAWRKRWWRWIAGISALIGGLYIFPGWWSLIGKIAPWITVTPVWRSSFMFVLALSLLAGLGANELFKRRLARWAWPVVGIMVVTMLWQWWGILPFAPRATLFPQNDLLTRAYQETRDGTTLWTPKGTLDQFMAYDIPVAMGYDSVYPKQYLELWSDNAELRQRNQLHVKDPSPQLLAVSGANLMLTSDSVPAGWTTIETSGYWVLAKKDDAIVPIHAVKNIVTETSVSQISTIDPATTALVAGDSPLVDANANVQITVTKRDATTLQMQVTSSGVTAIVTNLQSYPGWHLKIDGNNAGAAQLIVNHAFLGAAVNEGTHVVEFRYTPQSYIIGLVVSLISALLLVVVGWLVPKIKKAEAVSF